MNEELYKVGWKAQFISGMIMPLLMFVNNIAYVLVFIAGSIFVTRGLSQSVIFRHSSSIQGSSRCLSRRQPISLT